MTSPKRRPRMQKMMPNRSSLCPSVPKNGTLERSGTLSAASPPTSSAGWAKAEREPSVSTARTAAKLLASRHPEDAAVAIQGHMRVLQNESFIRDDNVFKAQPSGRRAPDVPLSERRRAHCRSSEHASTARLELGVLSLAASELKTPDQLRQGQHRWPKLVRHEGSL